MVLRVTHTQTSKIDPFPATTRVDLGRMSNAVSKGGMYMTANQIAYWNLEENRRRNRATEREDQRHNRATETVQQFDADTKRMSHHETTRHNQQTELIQTQDADTRRLAHYETARHNRVSEDIGKYDSVTKRRVQVSDANRDAVNAAIATQRLKQDGNIAQLNHNMEELKLLETRRHNMETENQGWGATAARTATDIFGSVMKALPLLLVG